MQYFIDDPNSFYKTVDRGFEIKQWLDNNIIENYCIIDYDADMLPSQMINFVKTSDNVDHIDCVDIGYGLTRECSERVINILNRV